MPILTSPITHTQQRLCHRGGIRRVWNLVLHTPRLHVCDVLTEEYRTTSHTREDETHIGITQNIQTRRIRRVVLAEHTGAAIATPLPVIGVVGEIAGRAHNERGIEVGIVSDAHVWKGRNNFEGRNGGRNGFLL